MATDFPTVRGFDRSVQGEFYDLTDPAKAAKATAKAAKAAKATAKAAKAGRAAQAAKAAQPGRSAQAAKAAQPGRAAQAATRPSTVQPPPTTSDGGRTSDGARKRIRKSKHMSLAEDHLAPEPVDSTVAQRPPTLKEQKRLAQAERVAYQGVVEERPDSHGGTGLFAMRNIPKGDLKLVYYGQLMSYSSLLKRYPDEDGMYVMQLGTKSGVYVDGSRVLSLASRVNHSSRHHNTKFTHYDGHFPILVNTKEIKGGQEVLTNYTKKYFQRDDGTPVNRGFDYDEAAYLRI